MPLYKHNNYLYIAVADPSEQTVYHEIQFHTGLKTQTVVVEYSKLSESIERFLQAQESKALDDFLGDTNFDNLEINAEEDDESLDSLDTSGDVDDAPIVRFVHKLLIDAIQKGASDIHFEPYENASTVLSFISAV